MARMRALAVLIAALVLATALPSANAALSCAPARADRLEPMAAVPGLPAPWVPLLALDDSRLPAIASIAASNGTVTCAVTQDVAGFAAAAGITDAGQRAKLAAATSFVDVVGVAEPRSLAIEGNIAHVQTWSAKDGLVVDWTIPLDTLRAAFVVRAVGVDGGAADFEGWHPWVGFSNANLPGAPSIQTAKTFLAPNPDGSQFRINYETNNYASIAQADSYAAAYGAAAQAIHAIEVGQWGFTSADADGTYDITADGCSCIFSGNNVNIHVHPKLEDLYTLFSPPLSYPTVNHFYRVVIGHEFHHHLQYSMQQWALSSRLIEGAARFSETIFEPTGAFGPNTITYLRNANGFSNWMVAPNQDVDGRSYDNGLLYGYLYSQDGGLDFLKTLYVKSKTAASVPAAIEAALADMPGPHDTFDAAYADFAVQLYAKSFLWASPGGTDTRDWATYLPALARAAFTRLAAGQPIGYQNNQNVAFHGLLFGAPPSESTMVATFGSGDPGIHARWLTRDAAGVHAADAGPATQLSGATDPVLALTRGAAGAGVTLPGQAGRYLATSVGAPV